MNRAKNFFFLFLAPILPPPFAADDRAAGGPILQIPACQSVTYLVIRTFDLYEYHDDHARLSF